MWDDRWQASPSLVMPGGFALPERRCIVPTTLTRIEDMTDVQLDERLAFVFGQHRDSGPERKANLHRIAMDILDEQRVRRDAALGLT